MTSRTTALKFSIHLILVALLLNTVQAHVQDKGPQSFVASAPQDAQRYKKVIVYLTPAQLRNYEASHGLPNPPPENPSYTYEQQRPEQEKSLNDEKRQIIQSTLDILEARNVQFQQQQNNSKIELTKGQRSQNEDLKPIVEPNTEEQPTRQYPIETQEQQRNEYEEQSNQDQEKVAKSYAHVHFFSNKKPEGQEKKIIFHPEPHTANTYKEIRQQKEKDVKIQEDPLLRQRFRLIPYQFADKEIRERVQEQPTKPEKQAPLQVFISKPSQVQANKDNEEEEERRDENVPQYTRQSTSLNNNIDLEKIIKEILLEREANKNNSEDIAKSAPIVIHKDIQIIRRQPVQETKNENVPLEKPQTVERLIPVEVEQEIPVETPVQRPEKFTILGHLWKHSS